LKTTSIFISVFLLAAFSVKRLQAQDLIITVNNDSIVCAITKVEKTQLFFTQQKNDEYQSTSIPLSEVKTFTYGYTREGSKAIQGGVKQAETSSDLPGFRLAANFGPAYRLAQIPSGVNSLLEDYLRELKWGLSYNFDFHLYVSETVGVGMKYSRFRSSNSIQDVALIDTNGNLIGVGVLSDDIKIGFIGPSVTFRSPEDKTKL
jgi:hypothetical protein